MEAPDFKLYTWDEREVIRLHDLKGRPVVLTFWASWCPDSQIDLAKKQTFYEHLDTGELAFLTINVTGREGKEEDVHTFLEKNNYTFPVLRDEHTKTYDRYQCMGVPTTFLLDEELNVIHRYNDKAAFLDIADGIKTLLAK